MVDEPGLQRALQAIERVHAADPAGAEGAYAERLTYWLSRLLGPLEPLRQLAARCQHLERWAIPRESFPTGRGGYLAWRRSVQDRQGERARELLLAAGLGHDDAERVAILVAKRARPDDADAQALEDAACLVFLERQFADFAAGRDDAQLVGILRKTWAKMSPAARELAGALPLSGRAAELRQRALG